MSQVSEEPENSNKRKKWVQTLSVLSSSEEEDLDGANCIQSLKNCSFANGQPIALRFPYPMLSDDSDEEELKYYPKNFNIVGNMKKSKKSVISSSENNIISKENESYKHNKRKRKKSADNECLYSTLQPYDPKPKKRLCKNSKTQENRVSKSNKENKKYNNPHRPPRRTRKILSCASTENSSCEGDDFILNSKSHPFSEKNLKETNKQQERSLLSSSIQECKGKETKNEQLILHISAGSRFLDSEEENKPKHKYRRLNVLSTSSSDSDIEESIENDLRKNIYSNQVSDQSNTNKLTCKPVEGYTDCSRFHSLSPSYEDQPQNSDAYLKVAEKQCLKDQNAPSKSPKQYLDECGNSSEDSLKTKEIISKKCEERPDKRIPQYSQSKTVPPNLNSKAWTSIAHAPLKSTFKNSHHSIIQNLKKQFVSSNASSVEIYKQIQNREINMDKKRKEKPRPKKKLKSKKSLELYNKLETIEPKENSYTVNVNVYCNSQQTCAEKNIKENSDEVNKQLKPNDENVQSNFDVNLSLLQNEENITQPSGYSKKIRYSHINQKNQECNHENNIPNRLKMKTQKQSSEIIRKSRNSSESEDKNLNTVTSETASNSCDVLGNILLQMENNRYKVQRLPVKKGVERSADMLGWFPVGYDPSLTAQPQKSLPLGASESQSMITLPGSATIHSVSNPILCSQTSTMPAKTCVNKEIGDGKNHLTSKESICKFVEESNSNKGSEIIIPFYSADCGDYVPSKEPDKTIQENMSVSKSDYKQKQDNHVDSHNQTSDQGKRNFKLSLKEPLSKGFNKKKMHVIYKKYGSNVSNISSSLQDKSKSFDNQYSDTANILNTRLKSNSESSKHTIAHPLALKLNEPMHNNQDYGKNQVKHNPQNTSVDFLKNAEKKIGPLSANLPEVKGNSEIKKDFESNTKEKDSVREGTKGIRIRFGGNVFRLTGRIDPPSKNIQENTSEENVTKLISEDITSSHSNTSSKPAINLKDQDNDDASSSEDSTSSDSSSESSDSSESTSSSSTFNNAKNIPQINNTCLKERNSDEGKSTEVEEHSVIKTLNGYPSANVSHNAEVETEAPEQGLSSENNNDIIICSSDSENNDYSNNEIDTCNGNNQITIARPQSKSDCNLNHNTEQNVSITNNVGKIRVRSIEDLGGYCDLNDNALSHASLVSPSTESNVQIQPSVQKSRSLQPSSSISNVSSNDAVNNTNQFDQIDLLTQSVSKNKSNRSEVIDVGSQSHSINKMNEYGRTDLLTECSSVNRKIQSKKVDASTQFCSVNKVNQSNKTDPLIQSAGVNQTNQRNIVTLRNLIQKDNKNKQKPKDRKKELPYTKTAFINVGTKFKIVPLNESVNSQSESFLNTINLNGELPMLDNTSNISEKNTNHLQNSNQAETFMQKSFGGSAQTMSSEKLPLNKEQRSQKASTSKKQMDPMKQLPYIKTAVIDIGNNNFKVVTLDEPVNSQVENFTNSAHLNWESNMQKDVSNVVEKNKNYLRNSNLAEAAKLQQDFGGSAQTIISEKPPNKEQQSQKSSTSKKQIDPNKKIPCIKTAVIDIFNNIRIVPINEPVNSQSGSLTNSQHFNIHMLENVSHVNERNKNNLQNSNQAAALQQSLLDGSAQITNLEKPPNIEHQEQTIITVPPARSQMLSKENETLFFQYFDKLFTEVVYLKIPKLVDDMHLVIAYDIIKEERLKKIDQLISTETIISEKRRTEKDFADMIRVRGHSFVPLFMTIVNKEVDKDNLRTFVTALYCKIIHQLERVDPKNASYRYKLRHIIKQMIEKHSDVLKEGVCSVFSENDSSFITNFHFVESLLFKYFTHLETVKDSTNDNSMSITKTSCNKGLTTASNETPICSEASTSSEIPLVSVVKPPGQPTRSAAPPPPIGNLDEIILLKNKKS